MYSTFELTLGIVAVAAGLVSAAVMACVALAAACEEMSLRMSEEAVGIDVRRVLELNPSAIRRVA